jgi:tetratricopeptide (TPR) repeat protein
VAEARGLWAKGEAAAVEGRYEEAVASFRQALQRNPQLGDGPRQQLAEMLWKAGEAHDTRGEFDQAVADCTEALRSPGLGTDDRRQRLAAVYCHRGQDVVSRGEPGKAVDDFKEALKVYDHSTEAYRALADAYRSLGQHDDALAASNRATELDPDAAAGYLGRARVFAEKQDFESALNDYERAFARQSNAGGPDEARRCAHAYFMRGERCRELGDLAGAVLAYSRAITQAPEAAAHAARGECYRLQNHLDEAVKDCDRAITLDSDLAAAYVTRGECRRLLGRATDAIPDLLEGIRHGDDRPATHASLAAAYRAAGRNDDAIAEASQALRRDPHNILACAERGNAYLAAENYEHALEDFARAFDIDPGRADSLLDRAKVAVAYLKRGESRRLNKQYAPAVADYTQALRFDSRLVLAYVGRADAQAALGRYDRALPDLDEAIRRYSNSPGLYARRAATYRALGKYDKALADCNLGSTLQGADLDLAAVLWNRAETYRLMGKQYYSQAIDDCAAVLKRGADFAPQAHLTRGLILRERGQEFKAVQDLTAALDTDPNNVLALWNRGECQRLLAHYDEAIEDCTQAIDRDTQCHEAYYTRGLTYMHKGGAADLTQAVNDLTQAIQIAQGNKLTDRLILYYKKRADAHRKAGDFDAASDDAQAAEGLEGNSRNPQ